MTPICPHCGFKIAADVVIDRDGLRIDPRSGSVSWNGAEIYLTPAERVVLETIVSAAGRPVKTEALLIRTNSDGFDNTIAVMIRKIRIKLGEPSPIGSIWRRGYFWKPAADAVVGGVAA